MTRLIKLSPAGLLTGEGPPIGTATAEAAPRVGASPKAAFTIAKGRPKHPAVAYSPSTIIVAKGEQNGFTSLPRARRKNRIRFWCPRYRA
jgi:hypothetical protein